MSAVKSALKRCQNGGDEEEGAARTSREYRVGRRTVWAFFMCHTHIRYAYYLVLACPKKLLKFSSQTWLFVIKDSYNSG